MRLIKRYFSFVLSVQFIFSLFFYLPTVNAEVVPQSEVAKNKSSYIQKANPKDPAFADDVVIINLEEGITLSPARSGNIISTNSISLNEIFKSLGVQGAKTVFPESQARKATDKSEKKIKLSNIYRLKLKTGADVQAAVKVLSQVEGVEYAEPDYFAYSTGAQQSVRKLTIDDPLYSEQWGLAKINVEGAWDDTYGVSTVTIAIVDSGIDTSHVDLAENLWRNPGEVAGNGLDDDSNGFIDDVSGWNFVGGNNNVSDENGHGTLTAGVAAAIGGNGVGIAGVCPQCTIMPVKVMQSSGVANYTDIANGVLYAAQKGAKVINLSLGGYANSNMLKNAIDTAVYVYGVVVVAGTGNDNLNQEFYPAAYENVLSVAGTANDDTKASFSNYGSWVDVSAPGVDIRTTALGGDWVDNSGTSISSPFTAGLAGLLFALHPNWNQATIRSQIGQTADNIDNLNTIYSGLLGRGRINAGTAMTDPHPLLSMTDYAVNGELKGRPLLGATASLNITLFNEWWDSPGVTATLSESDTEVNLLTPTVIFGDIPGGTSKTNATAFSFTVSNTAGYNHEIAFTLSINDSNGYDETFEFTILTESGIEFRSGTIEDDQTWTNDKTYIIQGNNLNIISGVTLTIQPGTVVKFDGNYSLNVRGMLIADGTLEQPIRFISINTTTWNNIFFDDSNVDAVTDEDGNYISGSILRYVTLENTTGGIDCTNTSPYLSHLILSNGGVVCSVGTVKQWFMDNTITGGVVITGTGNALRNTVSSGGLTISGVGVLEDNLVTGTLSIGSGTAKGNSVFDGTLIVGGSGGSIQENSVSGGNVSLGSNFTITENLISGSLTVGDNANVNYNTVRGGITVGNDAIVTWNNVEYANATGLSAGPNVTAQNNRLIGNVTGMVVSSGLVEFNLIANNTEIGLQAGDAIVRFNSFTGNKGNTIVVQNGIPLTIEYNNLDGNVGAYDLYVNIAFGPSINAQNNWWGSSDDGIISKRIFDRLDDDLKALVTYSSKLYEPDQSAPAYVRGVTVLPESILGIQTGTFEVEFSKPIDESQTPRTEYFSISSPIQIDTGQDHSCGLKKRTGELLCWGMDSFGETDVPPFNYAQVSAGMRFTCGLKNDGTIICWGTGKLGQLDVPPGIFSKVSAGYEHACGIKPEGSLLCWGLGTFGRTNPPEGTYSQVSAGFYHSCGIKTDGTLVCWGYNGWGQTAVPIGTFTQVSVGGGHSCGLKSDGSIECWGFSDQGQINVPSGTYKLVNAGGNNSCGIRTDGSLICWGQLFEETNKVLSGTYSDVSTGSNSTCAINTDDRVICWGGEPVPPAMNIPVFGVGEKISENPHWISNTRYQSSFDVTALIPQGTYQFVISDAIGLDGIVIAPDRRTKFIVDYAGSITDLTPPTKPVVSASGNGGLTSLSASWKSIDPDSPITKYRYGIGTAPGTRDVVAWTYSDTPSMTHTGLNLTAGVIYYVSAGARNEGGLWSESGVSNGIVAGTPLPKSFVKSTPINGKNGFTSPTLRWTTSTNTTSYEYCIDTTKDNDCSTKWISVGTSTLKKLSGLTLNATYSWQVRAKNKGGYTYANNGTWWSFKVSKAPGSFIKVAPVNASIDNPFALNLVWQPSDGATAYWYCYDKTNDNSCANWVNNGTATSKSLSGLSANTTYYWQVKAVNSSGTTFANSVSTAFWSFKTGALPAAFGKSSPANNAINRPVKLTIKWNASAGATTYYYCYDKTNDNACTNWVNNGTATSKTLSGLTANTMYYWHVRAVNKFGATYSNSSKTAFWSFKTGVLPTSFSKSSPTNSATNRPQSFDLKWKASTGATSYSYCFDKINDSQCNSGWVSTGTATSIALTGLTPAQYYWQVQAKNTIGATLANAGSWWTFTVLPAPGSFGKTGPANASTDNPLDLSLSWTDSSDVIRYEFCIDTTADDSCDSTWTSALTSNTISLTGLLNGTTYYWQVRAVNATNSTFADGYTWWSFSTLPFAPGSFGKTSPVNSDPSVATSLTLAWSASAHATGYEYCLDNSNDTVCDTGWISTGLETSVHFDYKDDGKQYYWQVRATNSAGTTYSDNDTWWTFTIPS